MTHTANTTVRQILAEIRATLTRLDRKVPGLTRMRKADLIVLRDTLWAEQSEPATPAPALPGQVRLIPTAFDGLVNVALHGNEFGHVNTRGGVSDAYIWDGEDGDIHVHTGPFADCLDTLVHRFTHSAVCIPVTT
jgi:hypothetical protein